MTVKDDFRSEGLNRQCCKHWETYYLGVKILEYLERYSVCRTYFSTPVWYWHQDFLLTSLILGKMLCLDTVQFYARLATTSEEQELFLRVVSVSPHPTKTGKGSTIQAKVPAVTAPAGNTVIATGQCRFHTSRHLNDRSRVPRKW